MFEKLEDVEKRFEEVSKKISDPEVIAIQSEWQKLMKEQFNTGAINYFHQLKIETAKQQIRSGRLNFTQISAGLGYQSVQYFSRQFKNLTGMTPTEYSSSIKALAENSFPE